MRTHEQAVAAYTFPRPTDVAAQLGVSRSHVPDLIRARKLDAINIGLGKRPEYRIAAESLDRFIAQNKVPSP